MSILLIIAIILLVMFMMGYKFDVKVIKPDQNKNETKVTEVTPNTEEK